MSDAKNIQYLQKLRSLLLMEYEAEKEDFRLQSEKMPLARKVRRGICWHPVSVGRSYYNSLNQLVVEIHNGSEALDESDEDPDTAFEYGKPIQFFAIKADGQPAYFNWTSTISYVDGRRMVATVPSSGQVMQLQQTPDLGVQLYFDETSYKTMLHALDEAISSQKGRMSDLRAVFSGDQEARKLTISSVSMPWLNDSQQQAVLEVLRAKDVAVVHGPPGTGKTTTLVEAICETLHRETQVLVCAQSNTAVDWIAEKLVDHGVSVLRIGNPSRVNDKMLSFTYERQFDSHPDYPELWSIRKVIRQIRDSRQGSSDSRHQKLARLRERAAELEMRISHALFAETRVVACTLVGAANKIMVGQKFSTLFIDEAA